MMKERMATPESQTRPSRDAAAPAQQEKGKVVSLNVKDKDPERSKNIVVEKFPGSRGVTIVGGNRMILAGSADEGIRQFALLIEDLHQIDSAKRTLVWMLDAQRMPADSDESNELRLLQKCLLGLEGKIRAWVAERALFAIANANSAWIKKSICGARRHQTESGSKKNGRRASRFFSNVYDHAELHGVKDETFTIFVPRPGNNDGPTWFGHRMDTEKDYPKGRERKNGICQVRSSHLSDFHQILPKKPHERIDKNKVEKLYKQGFLIFSFEKFLEIYPAHPIRR